MFLANVKIMIENNQTIVELRIFDRLSQYNATKIYIIVGLKFLGWIIIKNSFIYGNDEFDN